MGSFVHAGIVVAMVAFLGVAAPEAQEELTKRDRQGPVTVAVTLTASPTLGSPLKVRIVLDTHSVGLDGIAFDQVVAVRTVDGGDIGPTAVEATKGGGHHREAVVVFPPLAQGGSLRLVIKNVGGIAERNFVWDLPAAR